MLSKNTKIIIDFQKRKVTFEGDYIRRIAGIKQNKSCKANMKGSPLAVSLKCPLCYSKAQLFLKADGRGYDHCPTCNLISVPAKYFIDDEDEVSRYLQHENSLDNTGYVNMFRQKISLVRQNCPQVKTVLDYGCGYQPVLQTLLSREGYQAQEYDPNFFPDTRFRAEYDMVISTETFEHFKEPGKELSSMIPRISPKGYLAVMTRLYPREGGKPDPKVFEKWYYRRDPTHIAFYCPETFSWIANSFGFKIIFNNEKDFIILKKSS